MYKKAESVRFVVIISAAFILLGLGFVTFGKNNTVTGSTTYTTPSCYSLDNNRLTPTDVAKCCAEIRKSNRCAPYESQINDKLYLCKGEFDVVVNQRTIEVCG